MVAPGMASPARGFTSRRGWRLRDIGALSSRFGLAVLGPLSVAGSNAVMQFLLLRALPPGAFGVFAFMLGVTQFGFGLSNALVSTPYTLDANAEEVIAERLLTHAKANLVFSTLWGLASIGAVMSLGYGGSLLFGVYGTLMMLRWFGRAHLYALHRPTQVAVSDLVYGIALLCGAGVVLTASPTIEEAAAVLCVAALAGMATTGLDFIRLQFIAAWGGSLRQYRSVWRDQSRWSLVGLVSNEATSNAHSYAVSLYAGPAAFAPIAAAALLIKPIQLVITSLSQLERPVMARHLQSGNHEGARHTVRVFRFVVLAAWAATTAVAAAVLILIPDMMFRASYDMVTVGTAFALWTAIALMQCWTIPAIVLLQAAHWFRPLANAGIASAVVTLVAVIASLPILPPLYTLVGLLLGGAVINIGCNRLEARLGLANRDAGPAGATGALGGISSHGGF